MQSNHKLCQFIIKKYVKNNIDWPKEVKIAQKLIKKYKRFNIWGSIKEIKLPSLAWFLTDNGENFINLELKKLNLELNSANKFVLQDRKIGADKNTCHKPKTVLEFIRSWGENQKKSTR